MSSLTDAAEQMEMVEANGKSADLENGVGHDGAAEVKAGPSDSQKLMRAALAEAVGTGFIVLFGCGSVCSTRSGAWSGVWQVAACWGFGVALAIYATADISCAHLNPAITLAFQLVRPKGTGGVAGDMTWYKSGVFMLAQLLGAITAGFINFGVFESTLAAFERANDITRGEPESILTALAFGEYFPNPDLNSRWTDGGVYRDSDVSPIGAMFTEAWGTFVLAFLIFSMTHDKNKIGLGSFTPFMIGCIVACNLGLYAPITQAGWNPARDFGPRLVAAMVGWGKVAIPGPRWDFWIYIVGPFLGGPTGAFLAESYFSWNAVPAKAE